MVTSAGHSASASSSTSTKFSVVNRQRRMPLRWITELMPTVVPCVKYPMSCGWIPNRRPSSSRPVMTSRPGSCGVDNTFSAARRPVASSRAQKSVKCHRCPRRSDSSPLNSSCCKTYARLETARTFGAAMIVPSSCQVPAPPSPIHRAQVHAPTEPLRRSSVLSIALVASSRLLVMLGISRSAASTRAVAIQPTIARTSLSRAPQMSRSTT